MSGGFNPVKSSEGGSTFETVDPGGIKSHSQQAVEVPQNGYILIHCSNESNINVWFDNLEVVHTRSPLLEETHYYPFGLVMAGISSKAAGGLTNKKKWNKGSELQSEEFSDGSGLETYSTFYRSLDPQIGRFWQVDPKPQFNESMFTSMGNNPITSNDPLGDIVNKIRDEGVSKKEFREFKRAIRQMRRDSESFNTIYKDFNKSSEIFNFRAKNSSSGGSTDKTDKGYDLNISIHGKDPNQNGQERNSTVSQIAHETGHAFRKKYNLDPPLPSSLPNSILSMNIFERTKVMNAHVEQIVSYDRKTELGASHIENLILGQLVGSRDFPGIAISQTYFGLASMTTSYSTDKPPLRSPTEEDTSKFQGDQSANYYLHNNINIYNDHGLKVP